MAATKRTKAQREADRATIAHLYCTGWRQVDIAAKIGVSQVQISLDLKAIFAAWRASRDADADLWMTRELAKVDALELEYWEAWRRSCEPKKRSAKTARTGSTQTTQATVTEETMLGNPAYLAGVQWCIERRCKLLGLDAPMKHQHGGDPDNPTPLTMQAKVVHDIDTTAFDTLIVGLLGSGATEDRDDD